jgi:hypothetical protein
VSCFSFSSFRFLSPSSVPLWISSAIYLLYKNVRYKTNGSEMHWLVQRFGSWMTTSRLASGQWCSTFWLLVFLRLNTRSLQCAFDRWARRVDGCVQRVQLSS